jgi:cobalt-zinc-cadmium efflux system outer membrane protein
MKRKHFLSVLIFSLVTPGVRAAELAHAASTDAVVATSAFIAQLAAELRTNNPALQAAEARVRAAHASVSAVRRWEDPQASFGVLGAEATRRKDDGDLIVGFEQKLPLFGKPAANRQVAETALATEEASATSRFQRLRLELARQVYRTVLADHHVIAIAEDLRLTESGLSIAEARFAAGSGSQTDVLRLQNELASRREQARADTAMRNQERRQLNRLLNRPMDSHWPVLLLPEPAPEIVFSDRARGQVLKSEARLGVMRHEIEQARAEVERTRLQRRPDVSIGVEGRQYSGSALPLEAMVSVRMSLPWFNRDKYRRDLERDEARRRSAELETADYELFAVTETTRVLTEAANARRRALLHRDEILPRAQRALESATVKWSTGQGMLLEVIESRRMFIESRRTYAEAVAAQHQALAELALFCGIDELEALRLLAPISASESTATPNPPQSLKP